MEVAYFYLLPMTDLYTNLIKRSLFRLPAETAHNLGIAALRVGLGTRAARTIAERRFGFDSPETLQRFGLKFNNPLGMAAGFDKNGVVVDQLAAIGFGFVEVGTVTFRPQKGNDKPRLFRLPEDNALINRLGFNNDGANVVAERLRRIDRNCVVGVNIGKNRDVPIEEATENYLASFEFIHDVADYIAINVSSPNTPNLREMQNADNLEFLLSTLKQRNTELGAKPLLVKIAPDLSGQEIEQIADTCMSVKIDGVIATNTTIERSGLHSKNVDAIGAGGLSGKPVAELSNRVISKIYKHSKGVLPIIGVGGIFTGDDAFEKIAAGASLVQAYTGFIYNGPSFAGTVNEGLQRRLEKEGLRSVDGAIGCNS
ncbi:MAG: quinone-dependent dihydroorotate dehydrogenase [Acidobacteriota bacterium]